MRLLLSMTLLLALVINSSCRHRSGVSQEESEILSAALEQSCPLPISCNTTLPEIPGPSGFIQSYNESIHTKGNPSHRARDIIALAGQDMWVIGKFNYGYLDAELKGEKIDVYLAKGCTGMMSKIAETTSTKPGEHKTVEGVVDDGGRVYVELKKLGVKLPAGRHRILLVVRGDNSQAEMFIDVLPRDAKVVVTDVDGALSGEEYSSAVEVYKQSPAARDGAAEALNALYNKGYHILYLTARAEWFKNPTRKWLDSKAFPPGTILTTNSVIGATGSAANRFKSKALLALKERTGLVPSYAFGSKESDVKAFGSAGIVPENSFFYELDQDKTAGGLSHKDYLELSKGFNGKESLCPQ